MSRTATPVPSGAVAVVGMGLVVPGATSLADYWKLHEAGVPQFSEPQGRWLLAGYHSEADREDRGYAAKLGFIHEPGEVAKDIPVGADRTTRWLRHAIGQSLETVRGQEGDRWSFVLGYTADGSHELQESLPGLSLARGPGAVADLLSETLRHASAEPERHFPYAVAREAVSGLLPEATEALVVDAACSSGLYAVDLGIRQIAAGRSDIAVCAGAFALGWRDMVLFSKLRGLSKSGDVRPMDRSADGVLFSDGAAVVVLKALHRARADGDDILGVIAGSGVSCDGRGKAIYAPRGESQRVAIERAWGAAGVSADGIDAVVAHATGTPLGDATELRVLGELFADTKPVTVISPKAIVGHTGWAAGIVSLIHGLLIIRHGRIPPQHRFGELPEALRSWQRTLDVPTNWRDLPARPERPRAIGISAFGFGGTNAHLVLMDDHPTVPSARIMRSTETGAVLLDWDAYLPGEPAKGAVAAWLSENSRGPAARFGDELSKFDFAEMRLPAATFATMDPGQVMAVRAAALLRGRLGEIWDRSSERVGVFAGHMGLTRNGVLYALRCALGFLEDGAATSGSSELSETVARFAAAVRTEIPPASEDSYPGLMPNLAPARVANMLDARGLNLLVDTGAISFMSTLEVATTYLEGGAIDFAVVLSVDANTTPEWSGIVRRSENLGSVELAEGVFAFLLARRDVADRENLPPIGTLAWNSGAGQALSGAGVPRRRYLVGDQAVSLIKQVLTSNCPSIVLGQPRTASDKPVPGPSPSVADRPSVLRHVVRLVEQPSTGGLSNLSVPAGNSVVITNLRDPFGRQTPPPRRTIFSTNPQTQDAVIVADVDEATVDRALANSDETPDCIRLVVTLAEPSSARPDRLHELLTISDLGFLAAKRLATSPDRPLSFSVLLLNAFDRGVPRPEAAIFTGFATALAREFPDLRVSVLVTSEPDLDRATATVPGQVPGQLPASTIIYEDHGRRWSLTPAPAAEPKRVAANIEDMSVVVAAGGARGITVPILLEIARRARPKLWLLGTQDLASCPEWVFSGSEEAFGDRRVTFIRDEVRRGGTTPSQAARTFQRYSQARQTRANLQMLAAICGQDRVRYVPCDVTDPSATAHAAQLIAAQDPQVDLLLFAAGIERSSAVQRKTLSDFRRVRDTKVLGYYNLKQAFSSRPPRMWCNFGSVSSLIGARGLVDYCAGNALLGAAAVHAQHVHGRDEWTMDWPLWSEAGIGLEYQDLPWTSISPTQGVGLMVAELQQSRRDPHVAFLGAYEQTLLGEQGAGDRGRRDDGAGQIATPADESGLLGRILERSSDRVLFEARIWPHEQPVLADHCLDGHPTMPAMAAVDIAARAAMQLADGRHPTSFENIECLRFLRGGQSPRGLTYRVDAQRMATRQDEDRIRVRILSDVTTAKGVRLAEDIVHFSMDVVCGGRFGASGEVDRHDASAIAVKDPYYERGAGIRLKGAFMNTHDVMSGAGSARASFLVGELAGPQWGTHLIPLLLLDAAARIGVISGAEDGSPRPAIITGIDRIRLHTIRNDRELLSEHRDGLTLTGRAVGPIGADGAGTAQCTAYTPSGSLLAEIEGLHHLAWQGRAEQRRAG